MNRELEKVEVLDSENRETLNPDRELGIATVKCRGRVGFERTCGLGRVLRGIPLGNLKSQFNLEGDFKIDPESRRVRQGEVASLCINIVTISIFTTY
jgi:hypothetical protein